MDVIALGYVGVRSNLLAEWGEFASGLLGMQLADSSSKQRSFRMDDRKQRFVVLDEPGDQLAFLGFEVASPDALQHLAARLDKAGYKVDHGSRSTADQRFVRDLIVTYDPAGNRIELFHGAQSASDPFMPGRPISGFKTGPLGMGHAVLNVKSVDQLLPFYRDTLGFHVSDYGLTPYPLYFFHLNERHHSLAMVGSGRASLHHFMIEFGEMDDVGQGYDLAQLRENCVAYTLGRHTNDYMMSYYVHTPSGFFVENGWGGRIINPETWVPHETFCGPSFWGHDRLYMEEESRRRLREMRLETARQGMQAPPMVDCPWLWQSRASQDGK